MKKKIKEILLYLKYGYKANSNSYTKKKKKKGIKIGKGTTFYSANTIMIDTQRPWMIEIGENVHITARCINFTTWLRLGNTTKKVW